MNPDKTGVSGLQFDRAEPVAPAAASSCVACGAPVVDQYYTVNGRTVCSSCADSQLRFIQEPTKRDYLRAAVYGAGAALLGTILYFAILALSGYEIGLIAVAVGWLVGKAVQKGSRGIGGRKLQVMAVALTYLSIVGSYVPLTVKYAMENSSAQNQSARESPRVQTEPAPASPVRLVVTFLVIAVYCLAAPFLNGFSSIIGLFIIAIGLFEAWKLNRSAFAAVQGPFAVPRPDARA